MDKKADIIISEREMAIREWLRQLTVDMGEKLPVMPEEVYAALDNIKSAEVIDSFKTAVPDLDEVVNKKKAQARLCCLDLNELT